eukprot:10347888-Lingulodinium_polyedra.AAC.1
MSFPRVSCARWPICTAPYSDARSCAGSRLGALLAALHSMADLSDSVAGDEPDDGGPCLARGIPPHG